MTGYVPLDELQEALGGLTLRQIRFDIRKRRMPGTIDHRNTPRVAREDLNTFLAGRWVAPADKPADEPAPMAFIHQLGA